MINYKDFIALVKILKSAYTSPNFLPDEEAVQLWYSLIGDIPIELLKVTIHKYIATHKFPPTIAELRESCADITNPIDDWSIGYHRMELAIKKYGMYNETDGLASLDEVTRKVVERLGWKKLCTASVDDRITDRANFRMIYEQELNRKREKAMLPNEIRKLLEGEMHKLIP